MKILASGTRHIIPAEKYGFPYRLAPGIALGVGEATGAVLVDVNMRKPLRHTSSLVLSIRWLHRLTQDASLLEPVKMSDEPIKLTELRDELVPSATPGSCRFRGSPRNGYSKWTFSWTTGISIASSGFSKKTPSFARPSLCWRGNRNLQWPPSSKK